jgi:hypothetical protein
MASPSRTARRSRGLRTKQKEEDYQPFFDGEQTRWPMAIKP